MRNHTKFLFRGKTGCETVQNFCGVFPLKGKSLLGYVLKTSGHACVQPPGLGTWLSEILGKISLFPTISATKALEKAISVHDSVFFPPCLKHIN